MHPLAADRFSYPPCRKAGWRRDLQTRTRPSAQRYNVERLTCSSGIASRPNSRTEAGTSESGISRGVSSVSDARHNACGESAEAAIPDGTGSETASAVTTTAQLIRPRHIAGVLRSVGASEIDALHPPGGIPRAGGGA